MLQYQSTLTGLFRYFNEVILLRRLYNWDFVFDKNDDQIEHQKLAKSFIDFLYSPQKLFETNKSLKIRGYEKFGDKRVITSADIMRIKRTKISLLDTYRICTGHFEKMSGIYLMKDARERFFLFSPQDMNPATARILYDSYSGCDTPPTYIQE